MESDENTVNIINDSVLEYFKIKMKDPFYKGGNIYKLDLAKNITWNQGGGAIYDPSIAEGVNDKDKAGVDDKGTIVVKASVVPYIEENIEVEI